MTKCRNDKMLKLKDSGGLNVLGSTHLYPFLATFLKIWLAAQLASVELVISVSGVDLWLWERSMSSVLWARVATPLYLTTFMSLFMFHAEMSFRSIFCSLLMLSLTTPVGSTSTGRSPGKLVDSSGSLTGFCMSTHGNYVGM